MTATESYGESSRRGEICCLYGSLNLQIESKTRKRDEVEEKESRTPVAGWPQKITRANMEDVNLLGRMTGVGW